MGVADLFERAADLKEEGAALTISNAVCRAANTLSEAEAGLEFLMNVLPAISMDTKDDVEALRIAARKARGE